MKKRSGRNDNSNLWRDIFVKLGDYTFGEMGNLCEKYKQMRRDREERLQEARRKRKRRREDEEENP